MKKYFTLPAFILLLLNSSFAQSISLFDLVKHFTLNDDEVDKVQHWKAGKTLEAAQWNEAEKEWDNDMSRYFRTGTVNLQINGITQPMDWNIQLTGDKIHIQRVKISLAKSNKLSVLPFEKWMDEAGIQHKFIKCENPMPKMYGTTLYKVNIAGKKSAWLEYTWQCLKDQCSADINIYYDEAATDKVKCY